MIHDRIVYYVILYYVILHYIIELYYGHMLYHVTLYYIPRCRGNAGSWQGVVRLPYNI